VIYTIVHVPWKKQEAKRSDSPLSDSYEHPSEGWTRDANTRLIASTFDALQNASFANACSP